jgi:hypothetical protein
VTQPTARRAARLAAVAAALTLLAAARPAEAQYGGTVALGGGVAFYHPVDDEARPSAGFALTYRFGKPTGWYPTIGLNWFTTEFEGSVGAERAPLGDLRVRPVMGGYSYGVRRGRWTASAGLVAGFAFNSFQTDDRARLAYQRTLQTTLLRISAANGPAARAEISTWYDVSARVGIQGVFGYVLARPTITIADEHSVTRRSLRADALKLQVAVAYALF